VPLYRAAFAYLFKGKVDGKLSGAKGFSFPGLVTPQKMKRL